MTEQRKRDFLDVHVLSRLTGLALHARLPMLGNVSGRHYSPVRGSSLEFAQYRKYVPGDDVRRIDWRAYARSDRFYTKEFEADTNLRLCLVIDASGSMNVAHGETTKLHYARQLCGTLAYLAAQQGDAVGLYCARDPLDEIPPKRSAAHLGAVLDRIADLRASGATTLDNALHTVAEKVRQRALLVIVSDLFLDPALLRGCFQHLRFRKHDVAVFHLLENSEVEFAFDRPIRFLDLEGTGAILADPTLIAREYRHSLDQYLADLRVVVRDSAIDYHRVCIDEPCGDVLARFLLRRMPKRSK